MVHIRDLKPDPSNRRKHNPRNLGMVVDALHAVGAARSIVIDEDNVILAGNGVTEAAAEAGITKLKVIDADGDTLVAVRRKGLTPQQKRDLAIYDNRTAELAEWDTLQLQADLDAGLSLKPFFSDEELSILLSKDLEPKEGLTDPDAVPELRPTSIQVGDLFKLGRHRLLCGDATQARDIASMMGTVRAVLCLTDPPYSVNYDRSLAERGGSVAAHQPYEEVTIAPDKLLRGFLTALPADVLVMSYPLDRHLVALASAFETTGMELRRECIWVKDRFSFWPSANYQQQHEPILICARRGVPLRGNVPTNASTVFEVARPSAHALHPTEKPLELWRVFVRNHSTPGDVVFDPFAGAGTTLMACEELGSICHAIELAPAYCQVIIDRWEQFTGQKAEKLGSVTVGA